MWLVNPQLPDAIMHIGIKNIDRIPITNFKWLEDNTILIQVGSSRSTGGETPPGFYWLDAYNHTVKWYVPREIGNVYILDIVPTSQPDTFIVYGQDGVNIILYLYIRETNKLYIYPEGNLGTGLIQQLSYLSAHSCSDLGR
jgi:hypothetical protein